MIHAYLFVTANNRDRDGHGPEFHKHMYRINGVAGTKITVFHTFHDEVDAYRQHIWQCNGPCRTRQPYFGLLKRSMNRVPGPRDPWWERHQQTCGGTYIKIKEPDRSGTAKKETKTSSKADGCGDIRKYTGFTGKSNSLGVTSKVARKGRHDPVEIIKNDDSSKENISVDNVMRKKMSEGEHDLSKGTEKQNKLRSFASTSSGAVSQIKVTGASHSNVHGYGSHSPTRKKQRVDNGIAKKVSGSKSTGKNPGGSGATGLAVRGSSSQTVTVRGKTSTQTKIQVEEKSNELSQTPFQGHGYILGDATGGASRLLSLCATSQFHSNSRPLSAVLQTQTDSETEVLSSADAKLDRRNGKSHSSVSSAEGNKTPKRQKSLDCYVVTPSSSQPIRTTVRCPVCDTSMPEKKLNKHLDECIGNLSDEDMMQDKTKAASRTGMSSVSEEVRCLEDTTINGNGRQLPKADPIVCQAGGEGEQYPCPVCGECWSPATINQHLDSHF
ncbi:SprT-like domain-containing protein Spartan [Chionoecetes opilio]|uniref:Protein with SprT-like domain at the N terminus n=1 Tax=Chionoecetes opilio TaxID=41210 RepID=A0A8J4YNY4_CHIOP|nr:SprT-like domain-containing protein Spartan [Chionoecetes opilio]